MASAGNSDLIEVERIVRISFRFYGAHPTDVLTIDDQPHHPSPLSGIRKSARKEAGLSDHVYAERDVATQAGMSLSLTDSTRPN